ncbi:antibiotic biosynthesis monooxygenase family protein [Bradyrhizobium sp. LMTR 3]|nr:antibiotic biosynthesis monooxygenase family protein [Bradyrhizobium sp. LMTR 3]
MPMASTVFLAMRLLQAKLSPGKRAHRQTGSGFDINIIIRHAPKHSCHEISHCGPHRRSNEHVLNVSQENVMAATNNANQNLIVTAFWEVNSGEEATVAELLKDFLPQAQREPGVKAFQIHQNIAKPREFFFYEVFAGEAAFAEHQQTDHFKNIILGQAIPKLAKRERSQFRFI